MRRSINNGLLRSKYGIAAISPNFLRKEWPQKGLDRLTVMEAGGQKIILPLWHNVYAVTVRTYSPLLLDRVAAFSSKGLDRVVKDILDAI